ncbi:MAG: energy transducer TonB [Caldithrix sp.]|nr:MAG: energy transducer TonB [Caldithrix sp.]
MRSNRIDYRKRLKLGVIGALVFCHVAFFVARKFEFIPEIKQDNRLEQAGLIVLNIKPPPPKPKPQDPPPLPPEPVVAKKKVLPRPGPIVEVADSVEEVPELAAATSPAPIQSVPFTPRDKEPELIGGFTLNYPDWARKVGMGGTAYVYARINIDGIVTEVMIFKSSGYEILDEAALRTVQPSRWQPALQGDEPVSVWVMVPVKFLLHK